MNILICGGEKTINIVNTLKSRFASGAVTILKEDKIRDVEKILSRGDYFDRAIIMEPAWTDDGRIQDSTEISLELATLCKLLEQRCSNNTLFFFVATNREMAQVVYDESLEIHPSTTILVKEPPYSVLFFTDLITKDTKAVYPSLQFNSEDSEVLEDNDDEKSWSVEKYPEESIGFGKDLEKIKEISINPEDIIDREDGADELEELADELAEELDEPEEVDEFEELDELDNEQEDTDDPVEWQEDDINDEDKDLDWHDDRGEDAEDEIEETSEQVEEAIIPRDDGVKSEETDKKMLNNFLGEAGKAKVPKEKKRKPRKERKEKSDNISAVDREKSDGGIIDNVRNILEYYKNRGGSIIITGAEGSGKSTIAYNLANTINKLGFSTLLVDFDTKGRSQAYINKDAYDSVNFYNRQKLSLMQALGSSTGVSKYANIIKPGMHILTNSLSEEIVDYVDIAESYKMTRLDVSSRGNYNMTIYDMPFEIATNYGSTILNSCDNVVVVADKSTWGVVKLLLDMTNIEREEVQDEIFSRAKICFNKCREGVPILGSSNYGSNKNILIKMDELVKELIGISVELRFEYMEVIKEMRFNNSYENYWFTGRAYSDDREGFIDYLNLLDSIFGIGKKGR